ncbi:MAG: hypothetical protein RLZZ524_2731 [Pseudomonadota bacterium]
MYELGVVYRNITRTEAHIADRLAALGSATDNLSDEDRYLVFEGNARRVFGRLDAALKAKGL